MENTNGIINNPRTKGLDEKFCESCGEVIKVKAEICPKCGVRQKSTFNKTALLLLTFFFGGLGAHKFYLGKTGQGILYLLFFWTFIPGIIAFIEFIIYAFTSEEDLSEKYQQPRSSSVAVVLTIIAIGFCGIFIVGILGALAIPKMFGVSAKAKMAEAPAVTANWETLLSAYAQETKIVGSFEQIGFQDPTPSSELWIYSESVNGKNYAKFSATTKKQIGDCPENSTLTSEYSISDDTFVHNGVKACRKYIPNF